MNQTKQKNNFNKKTKTKENSLVSKELILKLFEGFSIQRWNDFISPLELTEMDRTGEKMFIAFFLGKLEEKKGHKIDWQKIIEGTIFELMRRIFLSDIKATVQRMIREKFPEEFLKINEWIFENYSNIIFDKEFLENFSEYLFTPTNKTDLSQQVLDASHKYATFREFEILRIVNDPDRLGKVEEYLKKDMAVFSNLAGLQELQKKEKKSKLYRLIIEIEKMRFQERWNQSPRVPKTSVLGHSFFVAVITILISKTQKLPWFRQYNNFFAALFHDLPEAVTRDIISPVKKATSFLPEALKQIENIVMEEDMFPLMDDFYLCEVKHYLAYEFENKAFVNSRTIKCSYQDLNEKYATPEFKPIDGKLVRIADHFSAFAEADRSISYGISSEHLIMGRKTLLEKYQNSPPINDFDATQLFKQFC